jgi:peptidoglycan hydrolase-like protein with peptidoglycan-binding domain
MYYQNDRKSAVREIQRFLFLLSDKKYKNIPRIPIDGFFDGETKTAVSEYQKIKGISPTGIVDYITFTMLYEDYTAVLEDFYTNDYILGDGSLPLKEGDQNEDVRILHLMITELRKSYPQLTDVGSSSYYSKKTGDAIEELRKLFFMPPSREFDKELYRRSVNELNARKSAKNTA